jgi:hypothetical protein
MWREGHTSPRRDGAIADVKEMVVGEERPDALLQKVHVIKLPPPQPPSLCALLHAVENAAANAPHASLHGPGGVLGRINH